MTTLLFAIGVLSAVVLLPLLFRTFVDPTFRIWPTPAPGSWQSRLFWTLFRALNVATLAVAAFDTVTALGLPDLLRGVALGGFAAGAVLYAYCLFALGKSNTYCNQDGLVTTGIYRWTRNPQYATIISVYALLAVAADNPATYLLGGALIAVYLMMALVEESWLEAAYGGAYRRYRLRVPRFCNWRRADVLATVTMRKARKWFAGRLAASAGDLQISTGPSRKR